MPYQQKGDFETCGHLRARNFSLQAATIVMSASNIDLVNGSPSNLFITGNTPGQIFTLTDATNCLNVGHQYCFFNEGTEKVIVRDFALDVLGEVGPGCNVCFLLQDNSSSQGVWISSVVRLSCVLINLDNVVGVSGDNSEEFLFNYLSLVGIPIKHEIPGGAVNCSNLNFTTQYEFIPGTIQVWLDGNKLEFGVDYIETTDNMGFTILLDPNDRNRLHSAPKDSERITISYCRRIIF